ncbi:MAG: FAD-dependent oxidoreductase [[Bacteroides] pectinophilus]|nr:FAD-dependent oxidoreductase [[Bacteroides] pectinophilus]
MLDVIIIGSGPAGLTASIYAKRAGLNAVVVEKEFMGTGQIADSSRVDNYPGMPGVDGYSLGESFRSHAESLGVEFLEKEIVKLDNSGDSWICTCDDGSTLEAQAVLYSAGCRHRSLGIASESAYQGKGVSYCAVCDGAFYNDKSVAVIGGGDTALDDALYLSDICKKVYLIHRRDGFRGSATTLAKLRDKANVEIITNARVEQITGDKKVSGADLSNGSHIDVDGIFVAVGMVPQTSLLEDFNVLDDSGYVVAGEDGGTSCSGLFVAGDARTKNLRQVITAASDGANAMYSIMHMLSK